MDFDLPADDDPRRAAVRAWCAEHPDPSGQELLDSGYMVPHWPAPFGIDADPMLQLIINEELAGAGIQPPPKAQIAINNVGAVVAQYGSEKQIRENLIPSLIGEQPWCQLYSEPNAGSDLAGLRTSARRDGDVYVVNGSKIWNSGASTADYGLLLARTDPDVPKHQGLSCFLMDMHTPGVECRNFPFMTGLPEGNEVFIDNAVIPADALVGEEGDGWRLATAQLQYERSTLARPGAFLGLGPTARNLIEYLDEGDRLDDATTRRRAAELFVEGTVMQLLAYRTLTQQVHGLFPGPEAALGRLMGGLHGKSLLALATEGGGLGTMVGDDEPLPHFLAEPDETGSALTGKRALFMAPTLTLMLGTTEVLRNVVGEKILGLPKDRDPEARIPWNERTASGVRS